MSHVESSNEEVAARRRAMGLFARARLGELGEPVARRWPEHGARDLKPVETGLVMLRGRAGGDGAPFNVGEATVTRAVVELSSGERGYGHILGRDAERARLAAILDALWQRADQGRGRSRGAKVKKFTRVAAVSASVLARSARARRVCWISSAA
ncbi:MAG: phosphonate C-P lyase system protein PhnG [Roseiarcus sp.]